MSSFLGVDFFRIVNEGLVDDWAQVYAKVSFEKEELLSKGALFGVLRIKGKEDLVNKSAETFVWLDEFFNKTSKGGNLKEMIDGLLDKNGTLESAWVWVMIEKERGKRSIKTAVTNEGKVVIVRKSREFVLVEEQGKVVVGSLEIGDRLGIGVGGMKNKFAALRGKKKLEEISNELNKRVENEGEQALAGLLLEVKKNNSETVEEDEALPVYRSGGKINKKANEIVRTDKIVGPEGIKRSLLSFWLKNFKKRGKIKIQREERSNKTLWLGGVFLLLFVISIAAGVIKSRNRRVVEGWQADLSSWQKREDEAKSLLKINPTGARKLFLEVRQEVDKAGGVWGKTKFAKEWSDYKTKLDESWVEVSGERQVQPKLFLGMSLIRQRLVGDRLVSLDKEVGLLDIKEGLAVEIRLSDKKADIVGSDKEKRWKAVGGDGKRWVFLTDKGLSLPDDQGVLEFDATVSDPIEVEMFGGGIYVLDAGVGEIWKFNLIGNEIQARRRWLGLGQEIGVNELVDMDIDGDIWVLSRSGGVVKLRRGNKERFSLTGVPENMTGKRIAVQADGEKLTILDSDNSRLVVFNKNNGEYEYQLSWEGFGKAVDIVYTEDDRLMVLSEGSLYWVE